MRIGIWCDYGFTLEPSEGIGVFVDCLARGLVRVDKNCAVVLAPHPGQSAVLEPTVASGQGRISVAERLQPSRLRRRCLRTLAKLGVRPARGLAASRLQRSGLTDDFFTDVEKKTSILSQPLSRLAKYLSGRCSADTERLIDSCDLWLLPYVGLDQRFSKPTVVVVHDLVCYHFADVMKPSRLRNFQRQVEQQTAEASAVACLSQFIKSNDLCGVLGLECERVQVIKAAVPDHLPRAPDPVTPSARRTEPPLMQFDEPFLLYPSAFRTYKNHRFLIELIPQLKATNLWPMKVVFTGIRRCPRWLRSVIDRSAAKDDVVMLGKVSREQLSNLYNRAFATVVPSLYEQGSFPLLEALQHRCAALSADIPSLREQFGEMGDDMPFFDPQTPGSIIESLQRVALDRAAFVARQQVAFQRVRNRTWEDAAVDWLQLFHTVIDAENSQPERAGRAA